MPIKKLCARAAAIWGIPEDAVIWEKGHAQPAGPNAGDFPPLSLARDRRQGPARPAGRSPGIAVSTPTVPGAELRHPHRRCRGRSARPAARQSCATRWCRMPARRSIPPMSRARSRAAPCRASAGRSTRSTSTARTARLQNAGFLDYRDAGRLGPADDRHGHRRGAQPGHPYGVRGVGETPIVPPLAAVANAVSAATGVRLDRPADVAAEGAEGDRAGGMTCPGHAWSR